MTNDRAQEGVLLPEGKTGSTFFHGILQDAANRFGAELAPARLPRDARVFKRTYAEDVVRFEAARIASPARAEIAEHLAQATLSSLRLSERGTTAPLLEALGVPALAPPLEPSSPAANDPELRAEIPFEGRLHRDADARALIDRLHADHHMSDAAQNALGWMLDRIAAEGGTLDLRGQRFVLLGAGAELSPIQLLLAGGAEVLWVDLKPPPPHLRGAQYSPAAGDLLGNPRAVTAAIRRFAETGPVHLGLLAYAPGQGRELRLAAAMNAIALNLGPSRVSSISLLISPTSPGEVQREDRRVSEGRARKPAHWQRVLDLARLLPRPGAVGTGDGVARAIIGLQGPGYQAAQYLTKIAAAEAFAQQGYTVSANVAGITNTRSLNHPLFQLAFAGAPAFGVRIFEPQTTRTLSGLLMLHDLLNPAAPGAAARTYPSAADKARAIRSQQIHGGVYDLPWQFDASVRTAAVIGLGRRPSLLLDAARGSAPRSLETTPA